MTVPITSRGLLCITFSFWNISKLEIHLIFKNTKENWKPIFNAWPLSAPFSKTVCCISTCLSPILFQTFCKLDLPVTSGMKEENKQRKNKVEGKQWLGQLLFSPKDNGQALRYSPITRWRWSGWMTVLEKEWSRICAPLVWHLRIFWWTNKPEPLLGRLTACKTSLCPTQQCVFLTVAGGAFAYVGMGGEMCCINRGSLE